MTQNRKSPDIEYVIITDSMFNVKGFKGIHFLPDNFDAILKAYLYIFHLPRTAFDTKRITSNYWEKSKEHSHVILLIHRLLIDAIDMNNVALVLYDENCKNEAEKFSIKHKSILGNYPIKNIKTSSLRRHWYSLVNYFSNSLGPDNMPCEYMRILEDDEINALPLFFLEHHLSESKGFFDNILKYAQFEHGLNECRELYASIETHFKYNKNQAEEQNTIYLDAIKNTEIPLSITFPGLSPTQKKHLGPSNALTNEEKKAIKLLGIHNACATNGLLIELDECKDDMFKKLNDIELYCKNKFKVKNKYIWRTLRQLGEEIAKLLTNEQAILLRKTTNIAAFTDFPLGLAILGQCTAPLCCYQKISYRNLTPLRKALDEEMICHKSLYITNKCNVLIIECLKKSDEIRIYSDILLKDTVIDIGRDYSTMNIYYEEIDSVDDFYKKLSIHKNIDILLISSHGEYNENENYAGICIGNEVLVKLDGNKIAHMPPVVLLSACHVRPRGRGCYSIVDEFRKHGALAVLGNYIPVDVIKNATIMCRFLVNIAETQVKRNSYKNILEVWQHVASSNAILEIADSHPKLKEWLYATDRDGTSNLIKFTQVECRNRLTYQNVYTDTLEIIRDMSKGELKPEYIDTILRDDDFFPESLFYEFNGFPEYIHLQ